MARRSRRVAAQTAGVTGRRGLDVRRYAARPRPRVLRPADRASRWKTFGIVKTAIRTLLWMGLPINLETVSNATGFLAQHWPEFRRIPPMRIKANDLCNCLYEGWKTATPVRRSVARAPVAIPRSLLKKSASQLRVMVVGLQDALRVSEKGRLAAIAAQAKSTPVPAPADAMSKWLAAIAQSVASQGAASVIAAAGLAPTAAPGESSGPVES